MDAPRLPPNEQTRLQALRGLLILDTPPEQRFDSITQYAAVLFDVPIALITLIDENRQWFKSHHGLPVRQTGRDISFCGHAILDRMPLIIEDAFCDPRFCDNPLVLTAPCIRFYAGAPLLLGNGAHVGTLCIIDHKPRTLGRVELKMLQDLSRLVVMELENPKGAETGSLLAKMRLVSNSAG